MAESQFKWDPEEAGESIGSVCLNCGGPNPDGGDRCGSCDEDPSIRPQGFITAAQLETLTALNIMRRPHRKSITHPRSS